MESVADFIWLGSRRWQPLKFGLDASSIGCINLSRCSTYVFFCGLLLGVREPLKVFQYVFHARQPMVFALESRRQRCPDYRVYVSCQRPLTQLRNFSGRAAASRPVTDVFWFGRFLSPSQLFPRIFEVIAVHQRPQRPHRMSGRYNDQRDSLILGLSRKFQRNQRAVIEPIAPDRQILRIPDQGTPTQTCNVGQSLLLTDFSNKPEDVHAETRLLIPIGLIRNQGSAVGIALN